MTHGYEFTTAITNIFIAGLALYFFLSIRKDKKIDYKWKLFFFLLFVAGVMGIIIHGIVMLPIIKKILWIILSFIFGVIINLLFIISLSKKYSKLGLKEVFLLTIGIYIILLIEILKDINFVPTYTIYALICGIIITILNIKNKYYVIGLLFQYIGGAIILLKKYINVPVLNHNGIYHLCMCVTIIFFYLNLKEKRN